MRPWGLALALLAAGCVMPLSAGCRPSEDPLRLPLPPPIAQGTPLSPLARGAKLRKNRKYIRLVRLQLIVLELPLGSTSDSEELWSYFNEEPLGARTGATLGLNGIRIGAGRERDWPEIRKILSRLTGRSLRRWHMNRPPGEPVSIPLKARQGRQRIFQFRQDRTLTGQEHPPGDNVLTIVPTINYDEPADVHITGGLMIRSTRRRPLYVRTPTGYVLRNPPVIYPLAGLEFKLIVPAGGFLFIGPSAAARRRSSPGAAFLLDEKDGVKFEKVLLIVPEVFAAPVRQTD